MKTNYPIMNHFFLIFSIIFFFTTSIAGQKNFISGTLGLTDGSTLECEFILRIKNGKDGIFNEDHKVLKYRMPGSDKVERLSFKELDYISVNTDKTKIFLVRTPYYEIRRKKAPKKTKDAVWCQFRGGCDDIKSFLVVQEFEVDKNGQVWENYLDGMGAYLLQRPDEDAPTFVGYVFLRKIITQRAFDKQRRKMLEKYFLGDEHAEAFLEGKKRIKQKELKEYVMNRCGI